MMGGMGTSADAGDAPSGQGPTPYLPEPTGPCPVGTTSMCLTDASRPDPWAAGVSARELMVSLWYPATASGGRRAPYMTPAESGLQLTSRGITGVPPGVLSTSGPTRSATPHRQGVRAPSPSSCSRRASPTPAARSPPWPRTWPATATWWPELITRTRASPRPFPTGGSPRASPVRHDGGQRGSRRRWWQAGPPMSPSADHDRYSTCGRRAARSPVPGHHPRLRPGLLRPAPARHTASPAGPAVSTLPRGHVLFPGDNNRWEGARDEAMMGLRRSVEGAGRAGSLR